MSTGLSRRQALTIKNFGDSRYKIHCGPMGCGKTYATTLGFGIHLLENKPSNLGYMLVGKTQKTVKNNICNELAKSFGKDFRYTKSRKDGIEKDATLFGHNLTIVGLDASNAEERIRGFSGLGILGDEPSTWSNNHFDLS